MKKLLLGLVIISVGVGFLLHIPDHKQTIVKPHPIVKQKVVKTQITKVVKHRVGDTQNIGDMNVTLVAVNSLSPTTFEVDISTDYGPLDPQFIPKGAWLYTSDGKYVHSDFVDGTHIYFTIPNNVYVDTFMFYSSNWYL